MDSVRWPKYLSANLQQKKKNKETPKLQSQQRSFAADSKTLEVPAVQEFLLQFRTMTKEILSEYKRQLAFSDYHTAYYIYELRNSRGHNLILI